MSAGVITKDLSLIYQEGTVLEDVSIEIAPGDITMIIGPNGAGKTTLARCLLGLQKPTSGQVVYVGGDGSVLEDRSQIRLGYVPQRPSFERDFPATVEEILNLSLTTRKIPSKAKRERVIECLKRLSISHLSGKLIGHLSGGEMQKVLLARALLAEPDILVLDELITGVDIASESQLYEAIHQENKAKGVTVIMITHDINVVYKRAKNVVCLNKRVVCQGKPEQTLNTDALLRTYGEQVGLYLHKGEH